MEHDNHDQNEHHDSHVMNTKKKGVGEFLPLFLVVLAISAMTYVWMYLSGLAGWRLAMQGWMGFFFLIFGSFKLIDWKGFVDMYVDYDIIAKRSRAYAFAYPLIELALGFAYVTSMYVFEANIATVIVMGIGTIGVTKAVMNKTKIRCACLGAVIKLPMTTVTIIEDVGMGAMALIMLLV